MFERIAIVGCGAIGGTIGGYLTRAGHDVTIIDPWADHVNAMKQNGLRVTAMDEEFTVPVNAVHLGEASGIPRPFDLVFLSMKSYDTVWAVHFILPLLKSTGSIVSAQNAVNDELIAPIVGYTRETGCVITLGAGMYEPGHVLRTSMPGRHALTLGEPTGMVTPRVKALAEMMGCIGPTKVTTNLWGERWAKLATNCMANSLCALTGLGSAASRTTPVVVDVSVRIASEVANAGQALGVEVEPINGIPADMYRRADDGQVMEEIKDRLAEGAGQLGEGRPSMAQDVLKGRHTEIDYLNGYVARRGGEVGTAALANEAITELVKQVERGEIVPDASNIRFLESFA
tara:strand:+ start:2796 stop:3827 length:1032 start_codon:yes stop_codon:yes gene_type:complete